MKKRNLLALVFASIVILISLVAAIGWVAQLPALLMPYSGHVSMVFNTSVCFMLGGIGVLLYANPKKIPVKFCLIPGAIIFTMGLLTLAEYFFNVSLGIDNYFGKAWAFDRFANPGRMAQNSALGFTLLGTVFLLLPYAYKRIAAITVQVCIFCVIVIGIVALAGHMLDLEFLYSWYRHTTMTAFVAGSFALLGLALSSIWNRSPEYNFLYENQEDKKILVISAVILCVIALVAGLAGFSTSTKQNEALLEKHLKDTLQDRIGQIESALERPIHEMQDTRKSAFLGRIVANGKVSQSEENEITNQLFLKSYSAFRLEDANGNVIYQKGNFVNDAAYAFALKAPYEGELLWHDAFTYHLSNHLYDGDKLIGKAVAEWNLDEVNQLLIQNDFFICGFDKSTQLVCLPQADRDSVTTNLFTSKRGQNALLEAQHSEEIEMIRGSDTRGDYVMAAVEAVPALSLSFLLKENAESLYAPMRHQLEIASPLLLITIIFGVLLLYWQVIPLLKKVLASEKKASETSIHLVAIVDHAAEGIVTVDENNKIETFNPNAAKIFGYSQEAAVGMDINSLMAKHTLALCNNNVMTLLHNSQDESFRRNIEVLAVRRNGTTFPLEMSATPMLMDHGKKYVIIMRDISERKIAEEKLQESEARFRLAFDSAASGVALVSLDGHWLKVNNALCRITGYSQTEMLKMRYQDITHPDDMTPDARLQQLLDGTVNSIEIEKRYIRKDGKIIWVMINIALVRDKAGLPLYLVTQTQEVTAKKIEEEELSYQAYYDALTGLVNRNQLEQSLEQSISSAIRNQRNFSVFFIDLDHFKQVNDSLGHDAGDELLKIVAERLKNSVRVTDVAARLGGDEFILVLNGVATPDAAASFAEKVMGLIMKPIKIREHELNVGMSIGISFFPNDGADYDSLIKSADLALYRSKELGRNNYQFCTPEMNNEITERMKFKGALEEALKNKQFHLDYLPKLDMDEGKISAVEALLRWHDESYGDVMPSKIIPVAEESGLILPLSEWIINASCKQIKSWQKEVGNKLNVAVNVSKRQFKHPRFTESVLQAIKSSGLAPYHLELEIAENLMMQDPEYSLKVIHALKDIGVQITLDNFGTGYSSLTYLHRFSVDRIKIDRGLIQQMSMNSWHASLVSAIVALAKNLGIRVAAEGVESKEQYELLKSYGCDEIQGYLISRPLGAEKVQNFLGKKINVMEQ